MSSTRKLLLAIAKRGKLTLHTHCHFTIITKITCTHTTATHRFLMETTHSFSSSSSSSSPSHTNTDDTTPPQQHPITNILQQCRSLKQCYETIIGEAEYLALLHSESECDESSEFESYSYQHHKYFMIALVEKASKDKFLSWQMVLNVIAFYSRFDDKYKVPLESVYNFLSIFSRRGDFDAVQSLMERLIGGDIDGDALKPALSINHQIFVLLIQALRIGGHPQRAFFVFEQSMAEFQLQPTLALLLQGYMCNPSKWNFDFMAMLNEYTLFCDPSAYSELIAFHLQCIADACEATRQLSHSSSASASSSSSASFAYEWEDIDAYAHKLPTHLQPNTSTETETQTSAIHEGDTEQEHVERILREIDLHCHRVLFYLQHARDANHSVDVSVFQSIVATAFDFMLHTKLSSAMSQWTHRYVQHMVTEQLRSHSHSVDAWKHNLQQLLPALFEGCLHRNQLELARDVWQLCEQHNVSIDGASQKHYKALTIRYFNRHGTRSSTPAIPHRNAHGDGDDEVSVTTSEMRLEYDDSDIKIAADSQNLPNVHLPPPHAQCEELAKNLLHRAPHIAALCGVPEHMRNVPAYNDERAIQAQQLQPHAVQLFLTDMERAIAFCRKYEDVISARLLYQALIESKITIYKHPKIATDFLFLLDFPQFREYLVSGLSTDASSSCSLVISPEDVLSLWPMFPPQPFINKAFNVLYVYKHAQGLRKIFDSVVAHALREKDNKKPLLVSPRMLVMASTVFSEECRNTSGDVDIYWQCLWNLLENKHFKHARTQHSVRFVGNKILELLFEQQQQQNEQKKDEDVVMQNVQRVYNTYKHYDIPLPLPLMQQLHTKLRNALHKSWIRQVYIEQHHPNIEQVKGNDLATLQSSMHIMNDYRWYIDSELFNQSLENGWYENLKPLRKLMIDGAIPASHRLIHRILLTFSKSDRLSLPELQQFLMECQAHYRHALSPKEKSLIAAMVKRYIAQHNIEHLSDDYQVLSMLQFLQSINISVHVQDQKLEPHANTKIKRIHSSSSSSPFIKYVNPPLSEDANLATTVMSDAMRFNVGETIQLFGLQDSPYLNGCVGAVVGHYNKEQRAYPVQLSDNPHVFFVAAKNMKFGRHITSTVLPPFEPTQLLASTATDVKLLPAQSTTTTATAAAPVKHVITAFGAQSKPETMRNKLLHVFHDQSAHSHQTGLSLSTFRHFWSQYFPQQSLYDDDDELHDSMLVCAPFEIQYTWNVYGYPQKPLHRIYYLDEHEMERVSSRKRLQTEAEFVTYLVEWLQSRWNHVLRLKDVCIAYATSDMMPADNASSHDRQHKRGRGKVLYLLHSKRRFFRVENINGDKYISLRQKPKPSESETAAPSMSEWSVYDVQYWLWCVYQQSKHTHNILMSEWDTVLSLFEGHHVDGAVLQTLTESELNRMHVISIGIQKLILSSLHGAGIDDERSVKNKTTQLLQPSMSAEKALSTHDDVDTSALQVNAKEQLDMDMDMDMHDHQHLSGENFYACLMNYHNKFPSEDRGIYQDRILEFYDRNTDNDYQWFAQFAINHYFDTFEIHYYEHNAKKCLVLYPRPSHRVLEINDDELRLLIKRIVQRHPIGIDMVSLLQEIERQRNGKIFNHEHEKYGNLCHRLRSMKFIVTDSLSGFIVFDSYS